MGSGAESWYWQDTDASPEQNQFTWRVYNRFQVKIH